MIHRRTTSIAAALLAVALLSGLVTTFAPTSVSAATNVPGAVSSVTATAGEYTARVAWSPATTGAAPTEDYTVEARDAVNKFAGVQLACGTCTTLDFPGLAAGRAYTFTVRARNRYGAATPQTSAPVVPTSTLCPVGTSCSAVDATTNNGANRLRAQGLLLGVSSWTPRSLLDPLHVQNWRGGNGDPSIAPNQTVVLSDLWTSYTYSWLQMYGAAPWANWSQYRQFVHDTVQSYKNQGRTGLWWDIQNEPDISEHYDWYKTANTSLILEQFHTAYRIIKQVDPTARVLGPSISIFTTVPGSRLIDLRTFLDFANTNNLQFSAISWHESGGHHDDWSYDSRPASVVRHVQEVRAMIAARPNVGNPEIHINEYSPEPTRRIPGWSVGFIEALERANVDQANLACFWALDQGPGFSTCERGVMDDLIRTDGTAHASYWVHRAYAEMQGGRRLSTGSTDPNITTFATTNGATIQALVGRSEGCTFSRAFACPAPPGAVLSNHHVAIRMPSGTSAAVTIDRIANEPATSAGIVPVATMTVPIVAGVARIDLGAFADGDAYRLRITPDDAGAPDPSPTTTALSTSAPNAVSGQAVTFTATVSIAGPPVPGGSVVFKDGGTVLGSSTVASDRTARLTTSALSVGTHTITAAFLGTTGAAPSASSPLSQPVAKAATSTQVSQVSTPTTAGRPVTLRAIVSTSAPGTGLPTGTVTFKDGSSVLGTVSLVNAVADLTVPLSGGNHLITATYGGDTNRAASTAATNVYQWWYIAGFW